jgi:hypothetical protein
MFPHASSSSTPIGFVSENHSLQHNPTTPQVLMASLQKGDNVGIGHCETRHFLSTLKHKTKKSLSCLTLTLENK